MSSSTPHLLRTAKLPRSASRIPARLTEKKPISASGSVYLFRFHCLEPFNAFPGQWVDCHFPEKAKNIPVGGFTCVDTRQKDSMLELVVKYAQKSSTANWIINESVTGDIFHMRAGGDFVYPSSLRKYLNDDSEVIDKNDTFDTKNIARLLHESINNADRDHDAVVFVGAGVGLNPILAILRSLPQDFSTLSKPLQVKLLLSSKLEHLYGIDILECIPYFKQNPQNATLFLTDSSPSLESAKLVPFYGNESIDTSQITFNIKHNRMTSIDVLESIKSCSTISTNDVNFSKTLVYICGPPTMTDSFIEDLEKKHNIPSENIIFEKWWDDKKKSSK